MRCRHCGVRYPANIAAPGPGGFESPGTWVIVGGGVLAVAAVLFWLDLAFWGWLALAVAAFVLLQVPIAWMDCRGPSGASPSGGETCPSCGGTNTVWPWSL